MTTLLTGCVITIAGLVVLPVLTYFCARAAAIGFYAGRHNWQRRNQQL